MKTIFTIEKLYQAYRECLRYKKNTANALKFEMNREKNLIQLLHDLKTGKYNISRHICFVITDPSPREIFAADFRDRIVHHLLYNEIHYLFEDTFIEDSYANRCGKGTHKAVRKLKYHLVRGGKDRQKVYFLKMDIKGFFRNIDKSILWEMIEEKIQNSNGDERWKNEVLWLAKKIIFHDPAFNYIFKGKEKMKNLIPKEKSLLFGDRNTGLPIGNLTSQFFANIYLNKLDHFIKEDLGFDRYIRYVDDFIILNEDRERLEKTVSRADFFLENNLHLCLCESKTMLRPINTGIDFLGYFVKPSHTLVRRKVVARFNKKLFNFIKSKPNEDSIKKFIPCVNSYFGHFGHANSFNLRKWFQERCFPLKGSGIK
jgi:retron-type reverse transcriptase